MTEELLQPKRQMVDGKWHTVHTSKDGMVTVDTGPDDQRPDDDGINFFQPRCVREMVGTIVYRYAYHCGVCDGELAVLAKYCHHCGKGVAHYAASMGAEEVALYP